MSHVRQHEIVIIFDFGSQYTQLIARRVREAGVYCEILPFNTPIAEAKARNPIGLILSGGPSSVYDSNAPRLPEGLIEAISCPVLGICYGFQLMSMDHGSVVEKAQAREYGYARLKIVDPESPLFQGLPSEIDVWMSH